MNRGLYANTWLRARGRSSRNLCRPLTIGANSPQPQTVMRRSKAEIARHLILQILDSRRKELDDFAAMRADHVIVMLMIIVMLVVRFVVAETNFPSEPCFRQ